MKQTSTMVRSNQRFLLLHGQPKLPQREYPTKSTWTLTLCTLFETNSFVEQSGVSGANDIYVYVYDYMYLILRTSSRADIEVEIPLPATQKELMKYDAVKQFYMTDGLFLPEYNSVQFMAEI